MSKLQPILSEARVQTLTIKQLNAVYNQRLEKWMKVSGHATVSRFLKETGGTTWDEFRADWLSGKITVLASELPEVDDFLDGEPMDIEAAERATEDYAIIWLVTHGEHNPVRHAQV